MAVRMNLIDFSKRGWLLSRWSLIGFWEFDLFLGFYAGNVMCFYGFLEWGNLTGVYGEFDWFVGRSLPGFERCV